MFLYRVVVMILSTPRLQLRPMLQSDAPALFAILGDRDAMRHWHRPAITRLSLVELMVEEQVAAMADGLCAYWTVWRGDDAIGSADFSLIEDGAAQLGFLFRHDQWGQGFAGETLAALIAHGFDAMGLEQLSATIRTGNTRAARLLEKLGFTQEGADHMLSLDGGVTLEVASYALLRPRPDPRQESSPQKGI